MSSENFIPNKTALVTLIAACLVVIISLGIRQTFGLFFFDFEVDLGCTQTEFGFAMGIQLFFWGLIGPIFGIIIADYYLVKKKQIINKDIFSSSMHGAYYFSNGWHIKAIYSMFVAFIFSASTIWNVDLRFLQSYAWLIGAFVGFAIYYLLSEK